MMFDTRHKRHEKTRITTGRGCSCQSAERVCVRDTTCCLSAVSLLKVPFTGLTQKWTNSGDTCGGKRTKTPHPIRDAEQMSATIQQLMISF